MAIAIYAVIIVLSLVIQTTLFTSWPFLTVVPDLVLVIVVLFSIINGPSFGAKFGFAAGLGLDLLIGQFIGMNALIKMLIGIGVGYLALKLYKENYVIPFLFVIGATVIDQLLYALGTIIFGIPAPLMFILTEQLLPAMLLNGILSLLLYVRLYYFNQKISYWDELFKRAG